jgi:Flp pilus assembly protein TadG
MMTNRLIARLRDIWRQFGSAQDGNTVVTFALAFIPLMGLTGAAVDYSRANSIKTTMQAAADTTALMIAQDAASLTSQNLQTQANNYYRALFTRTDAASLQVTATYTTTGGSTVVVGATATYATSFMSIMGFRQLPLAASSTASFGNARLRVALVLDNTGSMAASGKITALKTATNNLLAQLRSAATNNGDVYVSIIPFVKDVNLDSGNSAASWIYWDDAAHSDTTSWDANNGSCSKSGYNPRSACIAAPGGSCSISGNNTQSSCTSDGNCSISDYTTRSTCTAATGSCSISGDTSQNSCTSDGSCNNSKDTTKNSCQGDGYCSNSSHHSQNGCTNSGATWRTPAVWTAGVWTAGAGVWTAGIWSPPTWTPDNHNTWNGCVMDRGGAGGPDANNYDTNVVAPTTATPATLLPAEQYGSCPQAVMGLNYNWASMTTEVNNMSPNGSTNQNIGLALGWMSLVGGGPFTSPAMDANYTYQQVVILLTDGLNTQDRWYGDGMNTSTQVDARQALTCTNAKNAGIVLYMIQVNTDGSPTSTLLRNCATDSSKFFLLTSASQIVTTFSQIGTNLSKLRIAR